MRGRQERPYHGTNLRRRQQKVQMALRTTNKRRPGIEVAKHRSTLLVSYAGSKALGSLPLMSVTVPFLITSSLHILSHLLQYIRNHPLLVALQCAWTREPATWLHWVVLGLFFLVPTCFMCIIYFVSCPSLENSKNGNRQATFSDYS